MLNLLGERIRDALHSQVVIAALVRCAGYVGVLLKQLGRCFYSLVRQPSCPNGFLYIARRVSTVGSASSLGRLILLVLGDDIELRREERFLVGAALRLASA